jgi:aspartate/methionine/tyrosine aminotransferase
MKAPASRGDAGGGRHAGGRVDVVSGAGEPDFDTPQNNKDAAITAIRAGRQYTPTGIRELQKRSSKCIVAISRR